MNAELLKPARCASEERVRARPDPAFIERKIAYLLHAWPRDPITDETTAEFTYEAIREIFRHYPPEVLDAVVSPVTGLPSRLKWFPTFAEIKQACDEAFAPLQREAARDVSIVETRKLLKAPEPETAEDRERVVSELWERGARPVVSAGGEPGKPAPKTEAQIREEAEAKLAAMATGDRFKTPVVIGEGLAQKIARMASGEDRRDARVF